LFDLLAAGTIKPIVGARVPLVRAPRAHELLEQAAVSRQVALICSEQTKPL
jgi:NADPH:quinone reductase-like Zn-dependent oxidoreductase